ncbi:LANO_0D09142g1_1 [Lachancea nothofagi CBS 11611]|uniref:Nucleotide exchange factor SIL1 n=1 Tax=Lachancea nothofagi CBS 11611 TaxID=1266666 RepID=A0A1G4JJJ5_9SACH|nr:LANO_0D09142g1_1 [Lachancea nothofagi CBS 11611]
MRWIVFCLAGTLANELVTLSPTTQVLTTGSSEQDKATDLLVGDNSICNSKECYPKLFEPEAFWKEIRPSQHIPAGLDIRMNLENGRREAKLNSEAKPPSGVLSEDSSVENPEDSTAYEFSQEFAKINKLAASHDFATIESILDDLLEFSHDYKQGYKIIVHEFGLLKELIFSEDTPLSTKQMSLTMLTGCLRNNPPAISYVQANDPNFTQEIFRELTGLVHQPPKPQVVVLVKRYLSILQAMLGENIELDEDVLLKLCHWGDPQIKRRALEIGSHLFSDSNHSDQSGLGKRSPSAYEIQKWVDEFAMGLQDKNVDELHIRNFFNSLYHIKQEMGKSVKVDSSFLNWLSEESENRRSRLENGLHERDLEQDEFDRKLVDSRHLIFGNPMAHRIKRFNDEL